jgi:hypothetical protein
MSNTFKSFQERHKIGDYFENEFIKTYLSGEIKRNDTHEYDIKDLTTGVKYEIKSDYRAHETGNICFKDKTPSGLIDRGIRSSIATFIVMYIVKNGNREDHDIYIIPRKEVLKKIDNNEYKRYFAEDGVRGSFYIFDIKKFSHHKEIR